MHRAALPLLAASVELGRSRCCAEQSARRARPIAGSSAVLNYVAQLNMTRPAMRLGDMLVNAGLVTREDLAKALAEQAERGSKLGEVLVRRGLISEHDLTQILSNRVSVAWVCLDYIEFTRELLSLLPKELAAELNVIPVYFRTEKNRQKILYVAVDDPTSVTAMEQVAVYTGMHVRPLVAPASEIRRAIQQHYFNSSGEQPAR